MTADDTASEEDSPQVGAAGGLRERLGRAGIGEGLPFALKKQRVGPWRGRWAEDLEAPFGHDTALRSIAGFLAIAQAPGCAEDAPWYPRICRAMARFWKAPEAQAAVSDLLRRVEACARGATAARCCDGSMFFLSLHILQASVIDAKLAFIACAPRQTLRKFTRIIFGAISDWFPHVRWPALDKFRQARAAFGRFRSTLDVLGSNPPKFGHTGPNWSFKTALERCLRVTSE